MTDEEPITATVTAITNPENRPLVDALHAAVRGLTNVEHLRPVEHAILNNVDAHAVYTLMRANNQNALREILKALEWTGDSVGPKT